MDKNGWIIPFRGTSHSGAFQQNFLWRKDSFYIMDNHRAALWCWFQHIDAYNRYNLIHIDKHYDTLSSNISLWKKHMPCMSNISIDDYLDLSYDKKCPEMKLFSWDNYLSLFIECFPNLLNECHFYTYGEGDKPKCKSKHDFNFLWELPMSLDHFINKTKLGLIFNIDIDYFVYKGPSSYIRMFSNDFIEEMLKHAAEAYKSGGISVLTLSLSPECSGGWDIPIEICKLICSVFDISFSL